MTRDSEQAKEESTDVSRRGQRDSPRTPNDDQDKLAKLQSISEKLSPSEDANEMKLNVISKGEGAEMIEHAIEKRLVTGTTKNRHSGSSDVLFGGMEASIQQEAEEWIIRKLKELKLEEPADIYFKGNEFTGILYAKFSSPDAAEKLTRAFENGQYTISGKKVWCKKDLPIDIRAPMSFYSGSGGS